MAMSATYWEQILSGDLFTFAVGDGRKTPCKTFQIHAGLVAQVSRPLERLMNNGAMVEATERRVHLVEVDPEIFGLFTQWLYSGTYKITDLEHAAFSAPPAPESAGGYCIKCGSPAAPRSSGLWPFCSVPCCRAQRGRKFSIWRYCVQCGVPEFVNKDNIWLRCEDCGRMQARTNTAAGSPDEPSWSEVNVVPSCFTSKNNNKQISRLFMHIKLYIFADMFMIDKLKEKCLQELQCHLEGHDLLSTVGLDRSILSNSTWNGKDVIDDVAEAVPGVEINDAISQLQGLSTAGMDVEVFGVFRQLLESDRDLKYTPH